MTRTRFSLLLTLVLAAMPLAAQPGPQALPQGTDRRAAERHHVRQAALLLRRASGGLQGEPRAFVHHSRRYRTLADRSAHRQDDRDRRAEGRDGFEPRVVAGRETA